MSKAFLRFQKQTYEASCKVCDPLYDRAFKEIRLADLQMVVDTCVSMLAGAKVDQTTIKKIVGHSGAMTLTEKVYTHLDVEALVEAINKI